MELVVAIIIGGCVWGFFRGRQRHRRTVREGAVADRQSLFARPSEARFVRPMPPRFGRRKKYRTNR